MKMFHVYYCDDPFVAVPVLASSIAEAVHYCIQQLELEKRVTSIKKIVPVLTVPA